MKHIFLFGILQRCGSNYLKNLLLYHPFIASSKLHVEDFLLSESHLLSKYVNSVSRERWKRNWYHEKNDLLNEQMHLAIGKGLLGFLEDIDNKTNDIQFLLSKTPRVLNLGLFPKFFPDAKAIILYREGKAVVESGVKSKFWDYKEGMEKWNEGAENIINFSNSKAFNPEKHILIKYESLFATPEAVIKRIMKMLAVDSGCYPFEKIKNTNIYGSSQIEKQDGIFQWKITKKPEYFNPINRASHWTKELNDLFGKICQSNSEQLGYTY